MRHLYHKTIKQYALVRIITFINDCCLVEDIKTLENREYGSLIEINPFLFDLDVPEYVLDYVIMHELTHYFP